MKKQDKTLLARLKKYKKKNLGPFKVYRGTIVDGDWRVMVEEEHATRALPLRLDLANHSPTGFAWGYWGSGPAQLSLAILADCLGDDARALRLHQRFKFAVIGGIKQDETWAMSANTVQRHVMRLEAVMAAKEQV